MSLEELKSRILRLLREDDEFRYAVAGLIGLEEILKRLDKHEAELVRLRENMVRHESELVRLREDMIRVLSLLRGISSSLRDILAPWALGGASWPRAPSGRV